MSELKKHIRGISLHACSKFTQYPPSATAIELLILQIASILLSVVAWHP
jgi:hypothetical protein